MIIWWWWFFFYQCQVKLQVLGPLHCLVIWFLLPNSRHSWWRGWMVTGLFMFTYTLIWVERLIQFITSRHIYLQCKQAYIVNTHLYILIPSFINAFFLFNYADSPALVTMEFTTLNVILFATIISILRSFILYDENSLITLIWKK